MLISHQITLVLYFGKTAHEQQKHLFKGTKKMLLSSAEKKLSSLAKIKNIIPFLLTHNKGIFYTAWITLFDTSF